MHATGRNRNEAGPGGRRGDPASRNTTAVDELLSAALAGDACTRAYAWVVLEAAASGWRTHGWPGGADPSAAPRVYLFLDRLIAQAAPAAEKARLLASLLRAAGDDRVADLIADVLLAHGDAAVAELWKRWEALRSAEDAGAAGRILPVLARVGTPFVGVMIGDLDASDARRVRLGLAATEALARGLEAGRAASGSQASRFLAARHHGAVPAEEVDPGDLERLRGRVRTLLGHAESTIREAALRAIAALHDFEAAPAVRARLGDPVASTRAVAIRVAAHLGDDLAIPSLIERVGSGDSRERMAAIEALGRLAAWPAKDLLLRLAEGPGETVAVAAIGALGGLPGDDVGSALRRIGAAGTVARRRAAARALHGGTRRPPAPARPGRPWVWRRGPDAAPAAQLSLEAALRFAFPEARPYEELELSRAIGQVVFDVSSTRRMLVELGLLAREGGRCTLTALGEAAWRVERFVRVRRIVRRRGPPATEP